jgi:hypothetical protein
MAYLNLSNLLLITLLTHGDSMAQGKAVTSFYFVDSDNNHYEMDATESISFTEQTTLTEYPIQTGAEVADHTIRGNSIISLSGVISSVKSIAFKTKKRVDSVEDFIKAVRKLRTEGSVVTVLVTQEVSPFPNCIISNLSFKQGSDRGSFTRIDEEGQRVIAGSAWTVDIEFTQFISAAQATQGYIDIPVAEVVKDKAGDELSYGDGTTVEKTLGLGGGTVESGSVFEERDK